MNSVIIDREGVELIVKRTGIMVDGQHIPFRLMNILVLAVDVPISSKTLLAITKENVPVLSISRDNRHMCLTLPMEAKNAELKLRQYATVATARMQYAKYYLEEKIEAHAAHLRSLGVSLDKDAWREKISDATTIAELLGIEGGFSKLYFGHFFSLLPKHLHKGKRTNRPPQDPVNAVLSYLYSWLYYMVTARLHLFGFDPTLSYLHEPFRSHCSLSSDLLEPFRAKVNALALDWFLDGLLDAEDFTRKNGVWLRYESRKKLWKELKSFTAHIMPAIDDENALLRSAIT